MIRGTNKNMIQCFYGDNSYNALHVVKMKKMKTLQTNTRVEIIVTMVKEDNRLTMNMGNSTFFGASLNISVFTNEILFTDLTDKQFYSIHGDVYELILA